MVGSDVTLAALQIVRASWQWSPHDADDPAERRSLGTWKAELHERCVAIVAASVEAARAELATAPIHERGVWVSRVRKLGELEVYASMVG